MRIVLALISVVVFLVLEWACAISGILFLSVLPLASLAVVWWLGRLPLVSRLVFGLIAGFLLDSILGHPFGTHMLVFLLLAGSAEFLNALFSARDSKTARFVSVAAMLVLFFILLPVVSRVIG